MSNYYPPEFKGEAFSCPHCQVKSLMFWFRVHLSRNNNDILHDNFHISRCLHCKQDCIWYHKQSVRHEINTATLINNTTMIYPLVATSPEPNEDMPEEVQAIYKEARQVAPHSKRAAAALLRLSLEHLLDVLGYGRKRIFDAIGKAVSDGVPEEVQQGMDIIRQYGNDAVHPVSEIQWDDSGEDVPYLFELLNEIVEVTITRKKRRDALYNKMSSTQKAAIDKRDGRG